MEITITINTDKAEDVKVKINNTVKDDPMYSQYARFFDIDNKHWRYSSREDNIIFLYMTQKYFNDLLRVDGKVYLNDVYEALGFPRVNEYEKVVGWTYKRGNPAADEFIDFGLYDIREQGYELWDWRHQILLDFNVESGIDRF